MNTKTLAIASILAASLATAANAQTMTVTGTSSLTGTTYTYTYGVTPSFNANQLIFNFSDANVSFGSASGPLTLTNTVPTGGVFSFDNGTLAMGTSETFTFTSPDAPGGTLGTVGISYAGSGVAAVNGTMPAPAAAPEPGGMVALSVLFGSLGLAVAAKRRRSAVAAL